MFDIITDPNPILRERAREVRREEILDVDFKNFIQDMAETMFTKDGIGLAAPQVGKSIRTIVVNVDKKAVPFINPKIVKKSWLKTTMEEGCLSIPETNGLVKRPRKVLVKYLDLEGKEQEIKTNGFLARILQHEIDHLNGVLFTDKIKK